MNMDKASESGVADGIRAHKVMRERAARPGFASPIYGGPFGIMPVIPARLPPAFLAWVEDDPLVLQSVGHKPKVTIFSSIGHWIDGFNYWPEAPRDAVWPFRCYEETGVEHVSEMGDFDGEPAVFGSAWDRDGAGT